GSGRARARRRDPRRGAAVSAARVVRWVWGGAPAARLARLPLLPLAAAYWAVQRGRAARRGRAPVRLALPAIAVGHLSVGGAGWTPLAAWVEAYCAARGWRLGVARRGSCCAAAAATGRWCTGGSCPARWWWRIPIGWLGRRRRGPGARGCWSSTTPTSWSAWRGT